MVASMIAGFLPKGVGGSVRRRVWMLAQSKLHINYLELLATFLTLKHCVQALTGQHVLVRTDNTTWSLT